MLYVEISFDPQIHAPRGVTFDTVINGIERARHTGREDLGVESNLIIGINGDKSVDDAFETLALARPHRDKILGIGLVWCGVVSPDKDNPPPKFLDLYQRAREDGYYLTAHCNADQPNVVEYIWQCLDVLGVDRIDHGVNCVEDSALVAELKRRDMCLTVCPTRRPSDAAPRRINRLKRMYGLGLRVTINSDDPGLFASGYMTNILTAVQQVSGYSKRDLVQFTINAFEGSWLPRARKDAYIERVMSYAASAGAA